MAALSSSGRVHHIVIYSNDIDMQFFENMGIVVYKPDQKGMLLRRVFSLVVVLMLQNDVNRIADFKR